jgi:hypothetical protein
MKTLSLDNLMEVTGGKVPDATIGSTTGSSSNNDAVLSALAGIQKSIKDINNNNNGLGNNGLLFMGLAIALSSRNNSTTVIGGGGGGCCGGGYAPRRVGHPRGRVWW